jgi:hypothetical protein
MTMLWRRLALILSVVGGLLAPSLAAAEAMIFAPPEFDPAAVQKLINDYRRSRGLKPIQLNARLTAAAFAHSRDLARHDTISHRGSDGSSPWTRVNRAGYPARFAAENVGVGQKSMAQLIAGWRRSPPHNANLLARKARQMGVAMVYRPGTHYKTYWTLVLGAQREPGKLYKPHRKSKGVKHASAKTARTGAVRSAKTAKAAGAVKAARATQPAGRAKTPASRKKNTSSVTPSKTPDSTKKPQ